MTPKKNLIFVTILSAKQRIVSPPSRRTISVKFEQKTWIGVVVIMNSLRTQFRNFSEKDHFSEKPHFRVFADTLPRALQPWHRPTANMSTAPKAYRAKDVCTLSNFFRTAYRFRDIGLYRRAIKSPLISGTLRIATCRHISVAATSCICDLDLR